jgi:putative ABC transport system ATP-binding protein
VAEEAPRALSGADVVVERVRKSFEGGQIQALDEISFTLDPGEFVALVGPSGCGKSTLLNLLGALDRADSGRIAVGGRELNGVDETQYRAETVGFVFQFHHLIPTLTAEENVQIAMIGRVPRRAERRSRAVALLDDVGLSHRRRHYPPTLSGGERQRVAIARALANRPRLLLADEPTGALDSETGGQILRLLQALQEQHGMTILLVTNDDEVARQADRVLRIRDGRLEGAPTPDGAPRSA